MFIIQSQYVHYVYIALSYVLTVTSVVLVSKRLLRKVLAVISGSLLISNVVMIRSDIDFISLLLLLIALFSSLIAVFSAYFSAFNDAYMKQQHIRNFWCELLVLMVVSMVTFGQNTLALHTETSSYVGIWFLCIVTLGVFIYGMRRLYSWEYRIDYEQSKKYPSVSLCIPARNETHALTRNLQKAIASTYDKLEVLVVDDCSHDKTAQVIRSFAHEGVRFIKGSPPNEGWLGKNNAYNALFEQSSGEYLVFSGTDIALQPESIQRIILYMEHHALEMVSVLPQRYNRDILSGILQPMRHFFLLIHPVQTTPVLSSFWVIKRSTLKKYGSFAAVKATLFPEKYFANILTKKQAYAFIAGSPVLGIGTRKRMRSQYETSVRLHYPSFRRLWPITILYAVVFAVIGLSPYILLFTSLSGSGFVLIALCILCQYILFGLLSYRTNPSLWPLMLVILPYKLLQESILLCVSALLYELNEIQWKERNVCEPILVENT